MADWSTVLVPAFFEENSELNHTKLKKISESTGVDVVTLKNAFTGKGVGFLLKTGDYSRIENIVNGFKNHEIPCLPVNAGDVDNSVKVVKVKRISPLSNGMKIESIDNEFFALDKSVVVIADTPSPSVESVKKLVVSSKKLVILKAGFVFPVNFEKVRVLNFDGKVGLSQKANLVDILERMKTKGNLLIDTSFYFHREFFLNDLELYAKFLSYAILNNFYNVNLPDWLIVKSSERERPVYKHSIYRTKAEIMKFQYKKSKMDRLVYPPYFFVIAIFFLLMTGFRFEPFFAFSGFLMAFLVSTYKLFKIWKIKNLIVDTPTSKIRSVAAGFVEVSGRVFSKQPVVSPISGSPCVFFRYEKQVLRTRTSLNGRRRTRWETVEAGEGFSDGCVISDGTGEIGVNLKNATFVLTTKYETTQKYTDLKYGLYGNAGVRYIEEYLMNNQSVYALGTAKPVSKSVSYGKFLSELKRDKDAMDEFDLNGDGIVDPVEWEIAQKRLKDKFLEYKQIKGQAIDLVIDIDKSNRVFLISNEKEESILSRLKFALPFYFAGSLIFLVLTLWSFTLAF